MTEELAPCPFCGAAAEVTLHDGEADTWIARCANRLCTTWPSTDCLSYDGAIAAWNRRPALAAAPVGWQPIETAPKDGTRVMLTCAGYKAPQWPYAHPDADKDIYLLARYTGEFWEPFVPNNWTHWMSLPAPPVAAAQGEQPNTQTSDLTESTGKAATGREVQRG